MAVDSSPIAPLWARPASRLPPYLRHDDTGALDPDTSAYRALTDFQIEFPTTVSGDCSIDVALDEMIRLGVHALVVADEEPVTGDYQIIGLLTFCDIRRTHPGLLRGSKDTLAYEKARVSDVMTSWDELSLVKYESLRGLNALDLYEMFQGTGLTHLLVVDGNGTDEARVRGLISRARLAKRLHLPPRERGDQLTGIS
jgi:CBS domain-containing protein